MRCEDFPACGHELGCCPDFDDSGRQLNMKCTCGATVPLSSRSSLCPSCLRSDDPDDRDADRFFDEDEEDEEWDDEDDDGQPSEYTEWQDLHGGDDWDHGQYDNEY